MTRTETAQSPAVAVLALAALLVALLACGGGTGSPEPTPRILPTVVPTNTPKLPVTYEATLPPTSALATVTALPLGTRLPTAAQSGTIASENANRRGGPGTTYAIAGGVKAGEPLEVAGRNAALTGCCWQTAHGSRRVWSTV